MKPKRTRSRKLARMAHSRWVAYGAAGAATAAGVATAEAEIHYSGIINEPISFSEKTFPLSNGAVLWFEHSQTTTDYTWAKFELRSAAVSNGWRSEGAANGPRNLTASRPVSHGSFGDGLAILATAPSCFGYQFCHRGFAILGFKFNTGGGTQYGWARLRMRGKYGHPRNAFYVVDYAWADVGEGIRTLQTDQLSQEQGSVTPSGSLGLLALGKAGLELWRAQRLSSVTGK